MKTYDVEIEPGKFVKITTGCSHPSEYNIPPNLDVETYSLYKKIMEGIFTNQRCGLLNEYGHKIWEEPLEDYNKRMENFGGDNS